MTILYDIPVICGKYNIESSEKITFGKIGISILVFIYLNRLDHLALYNQPLFLLD
ncbi:MAG: hypothetical protein SH817_19140 [Leptospira sp.]|nr:hypothetical protein [Leptospira sp.]